MGSFVPKTSGAILTQFLSNFISGTSEAVPTQFGPTLEATLAWPMASLVPETTLEAIQATRFIFVTETAEAILLRLVGNPVTKSSMAVLARFRFVTETSTARLIRASLPMAPLVLASLERPDHRATGASSAFNSVMPPRRRLTALCSRPMLTQRRLGISHVLRSRVPTMW